MDKMPILAVIFQGIPESIVLFSFGIAIIGEYINIKKVVLIAILYTLLVMYIRSIVPYFGLHIIIVLFIQAFIYWKIFNIEVKNSVLSTILGMSVLILLETLILPIFYTTFGTTMLETFKNETQRILYPLPVILLFGLITFMIYKTKWSIIKGKRNALNEIR
jgi:hypothetical protein